MIIRIDQLDIHIDKEKSMDDLNMKDCSSPDMVIPIDSRSLSQLSKEEDASLEVESKSVKRYKLQPRDLQALIDQVISHPLDNHVALPRRQRFLVNAKDQGLAGLFHGNATRTLQINGNNSTLDNSVVISFKSCSTA